MIWLWVFIGGVSLIYLGIIFGTAKWDKNPPTEY